MNTSRCIPGIIAALVGSIAAASPNDDFDDGVIDTGIWEVGGRLTSWTPSDQGNWVWTHDEIVEGGDPDGFLRVRVQGPGSANSYGAIAWVTTTHDFNDGSPHILNLTWKADVSETHFQHYHIQVTDGYLPTFAEFSGLPWAGNPPPVPMPGTTALLADDEQNPLLGKHYELDTEKTTWSISISPAAVARLYDGPDARGSLIREGALDPGRPWYVRFMIDDATSAGYPPGDSRFDLYSFLEVPDCNGNGIPDAEDIASGTSQDCNANGIPDECDVTLPVWTLTDATGPGPRADHAMAFDSLVNRTVLFGGNDGGPLGDTWERDGDTWNQRLSTPNPGPRWSHRMVYDSDRDVIVLFGGTRDAAQLLGDTWEWSSTTSSWTHLPVTGPSPRDGHSMSYDSGRGVIVLFGGWHNSYDGETWEWDGTAWTQRFPATSPTPRQTHAMAYDSRRGVTVLFGGFYYDGSLHYYGDTWEWDGSTWTLRATTGPSPSIEHAMTYDSDRGVIVLFGGRTSGGAVILGETWEWDGSTWTIVATTGPSPRYSHNMVYDSARSATVLFGGDDGSYDGETWEYRPISQDCNMNDVPDECEPDFDDDGLIDDCDSDTDNDTVENADDACDYTPGGVTPVLDPESCLYGTLRCDYDGDCDCDLLDWAEMQVEFTGPNP